MKTHVVAVNIHAICVGWCRSDYYSIDTMNEYTSIYAYILHVNLFFNYSNGITTHRKERSIEQNCFVRVKKFIALFLANTAKRLSILRALFHFQLHHFVYLFIFCFWVRATAPFGLSSFTGECSGRDRWFEYECPFIITLFRIFSNWPDSRHYYIYIHPTDPKWYEKKENN